VVLIGGDQLETAKVPGSEMAPGPGREAEPSTAPLPVAGMQKVEARVMLFGAPGASAPAGVPFSVLARRWGLPKQPGALSY
jgi:hypothetical protein